MCLECGFYNGRQVLDLAAEKEKRTERMKRKAEAINAQQEEAAPSETEEKSDAAAKEQGSDKK